MLRPQRRQPISRARLIALRIRSPVLPSRMQIATRRWSLRVDTAVRVAADRAAQRSAADRASVGAAHDHAVRIQRFSQPARRKAVGMRVGFAPVEGDAEVGAAAQTGMGLAGYGTKAKVEVERYTQQIKRRRYGIKYLSQAAGLRSAASKPVCQIIRPCSAKRCRRIRNCSAHPTT